MRTAKILASAVLVCAPMLATTQPIRAQSHGEENGPCLRRAFCKVDAIQTKPFDPDAIEVISAAFEGVLRELRIDRSDRFAALLARRTKTVFVERGERDPIKLRDLVLKSLREFERGRDQN